MSEPSREHPLVEFLRARGASAAAGASLVARVRAARDFVNLRGRYEDAAFRALAEDVLHQPLPQSPNTLTRGAHEVYWLGPDEWLIASPADSAVVTALGGRVPAANALHGGLLQLDLVGEAGPELLARGCTLDLHPHAFPAGACAQTALAKASVLIGRPGEEDSLTVIVRRSFAEYVALWLADAGEEAGLDFVVE